MSDSEEETPVSAKNLIKGYETGEVYQPGEVKPSEKPEINEPVAKNLISSFESGSVYSKGDVASEKPDITEPVAKHLITSFEKGDVSKPAELKHEKPVSRPGATRKLQKVYESIDAEAKVETVPLSPTSNAKSPVTKSPPNEREPPNAAANNVDSKKTKTEEASESAPLVIKDKTKKTVLLVLAHWKRKGSFNGALFNTAEHTLTKLGYNVIMSDLYAMKWDPVVSMSDTGETLASIPDEHLDYLAEIKEAVENGTVAKDISVEQEKVKAADLVILQFPIAWLSFPAILKGWMDRVLCNGFAFVTEKGKLFDEGFMKGKKAMLSLTTGGTETVYGNAGLNGDIEVALWPMHYGALRFSGFDVLAPQISYGVTLADEGKRKAYLAAWEKRLKTIFDEEPLNFVPLSQFDLKKGLVLTEDSPVMKTAPKNTGLTVGQNLGKAFPRGSMTGNANKLMNGE